VLVTYDTDTLGDRGEGGPCLRGVFEALLVVVGEHKDMMAGERGDRVTRPFMKGGRRCQQSSLGERIHLTLALDGEDVRARSGA
jgi:hypothetical protein